MTTNYNDLDEFSPLWGLDAKKFVLLRLRPDSNELKDYLIFNKETRSAKIIENADVALEVRRRMVEAGVGIVNTLPNE